MVWYAPEPHRLIARQRKSGPADPNNAGPSILRSGSARKWRRTPPHSGASRHLHGRDRLGGGGPSLERTRLCANSLLTGKRTGNSRNLGPSATLSRETCPLNQMLRGKFPNTPNREFFQP